MNYQSAYLTMFTQLTDLIQQLESLDPAKERINVIPLLKSIQQQGEEACIAIPTA